MRGFKFVLNIIFSGATPHYALPWHHVNTFTNPYGCPMAFNTPMAPEANSYWACIYGGYPVPR